MEGVGGGGEDKKWGRGNGFGSCAGRVVFTSLHPTGMHQCMHTHLHTHRQAGTHVFYGVNFERRLSKERKNKAL